MKDALLKTGLAGSAIAVLCCVTPILVLGFGVVGFSAAVGYLDYVLIPALIFFLFLTGVALWRRRKTKQSCNRP